MYTGAGGTGALLTRISPTGVVTANIGAPLSQLGDLKRGQDGFLYTWMNITPTQTSLCQILPNGSVSTIFILPGFQGFGIEQNAAGEILIGTSSTSPTSGVYRRTTSGTMAAVNSTGIPSGDHRHLLFDPAGTLFAADASSIHQVNTSTTSSVYEPPTVQGFNNLTCLENGYFDHFITGERLFSGTSTPWQITSVTPEGFPTRLAGLGIASNLNPHLL